MRGALVISAVTLAMLLLASSALADIHAVAKPETQTVPINGTAADFDGSDSYTEDPPCPVTDWAWDFDGDGEDDYSESQYDRWGDGLTTYVYDQAGIFTCRLTVRDNMEREDIDTQEVKVRLTVTSGRLTGRRQSPLHGPINTLDSSGTVIQTMTVKDKNVVSVTIKVVPD